MNDDETTTLFDDSLEDNGFTMAHLTTMTRLRAKPIMENGVAYDEDWSDPDPLAFEGYIASTASSETVDGDNPRDMGTTTIKQLIVPNPNIDIREHDRIQVGDTIYRVTGIPADDTNPFTAWRPTLVADLETVQGGS